MDRSKALEKALRLVLLATDPCQVKDGQPSEEGRTVAFKACLIIREHRLLGLEDQTRPTSTPTPTPPPPPPPAPRREREHRRGRKKSRKPGPWASAWGTRGSPQPPPPEPGTPPTGMPTGARFMSAQFSGQCQYCGFPINKGDPIYWVPAFGSDHKACAFKRAGLKVE
jgi:hypothetical protein